MMRVIFMVLFLAVAACSKPKPPSPEMDSQGQGAAVSPSQQLSQAMKIAFETVYFDFDSDQLTKPAQANLKNLATALKANPGVKIKIEGHSDERGSNEYNLALGERRAAAIKIFLISEGIAARDVVTASVGEEKPVELGHQENSWAKNRRGVFALLK